jgi:hypothetical protein
LNKLLISKNMLEFIIALLLALGYNLEDKTTLPELSPETMDVIRADDMYEKLGGDKEFNAVFSTGNDEVKPQDDIVIGIDPDPAEEEHI